MPDVPTHDVLGVPRGKDSPPPTRYGPRALGVAQHDARGAIAEQRCRHDRSQIEPVHQLGIEARYRDAGNGVDDAPISLSSMPAARIAPTATTCSRSSAWCRNTSVRSSQPRSRSYQSDGSHVYRVSIAVLRTGPHSRQRSGKSRLARRAASAWPSLLPGTAVAMPAISKSKATLRPREVRIARAVLSISRSREAGLFRKCQFGPSSIMGTSGCAAARISILRVDRVKIAAIGDLPSDRVSRACLRTANRAVRCGL